MDQPASRASDAQSRTSVERRGDRELIVTRTFNAPPSTVFRAWSQPELFQRWWVPKSIPSISLVSCEMDVRTGGTYRLEFGAGGSDTMVFHGRYLDLVLLVAPRTGQGRPRDRHAEGLVVGAIVEHADLRRVQVRSRVL